MIENLIQLEQKLLKINALNNEDNLLSPLGTINLKFGLLLLDIMQSYPTLSSISIDLWKIPISKFGEDTLESSFKINDITWDEPKIIKQSHEFQEFRMKCYETYSVPFLNAAMLSMKTLFKDPYILYPLAAPNHKEENEETIMKYFIHNQIIKDEDLSFPALQFPYAPLINNQRQSSNFPLVFIKTSIFSYIKDVFTNNKLNQDFVKQFGDTIALTFNFRDSYNNDLPQVENQIIEVLQTEVLSYLKYLEMEDKIQNKPISHKKKI